MSYLYITSKETRERIHNHLDSYFGGQGVEPSDPEDTMCVLDDLNANDGTFGEDYLISFDWVGNVQDHVGGAVMVSFASKSLGHSVIVNPMFGTEYPNVHELGEAVIMANDEALRVEQRLEILEKS